MGQIQPFPHSEIWEKGVIIEEAAAISYMVERQDGFTMWRNSKHLWQTKESMLYTEEDDDKLLACPSDDESEDEKDDQLDYIKTIGQDAIQCIDQTTRSGHVVKQLQRVEDYDTSAKIKLI